MADAPLQIILEMVNTIIASTIMTFERIFALFGSLMESLGVVSSVGGPAGFAVSVLVIGIVGFFLLKFVFGVGKKLILLVIVGIVLMYVILLGAVL